MRAALAFGGCPLILQNGAMSSPESTTLLNTSSAIQSNPIHGATFSPLLITRSRRPRPAAFVSRGMATPVTSRVKGRIK